MRVTDVPPAIVQKPLPTFQYPSAVEDKNHSSPADTEPYTHYNLTVVYDHDKGILDVVEGITYVHHYQIPLTSITLLIEPNKYPKAFSLNSLEWEKEKAIAHYQLEKERLIIPLPQSLTYHEQIHFTLNYQLTLPQREGTFGKGKRQTNLADWYVQIPPLQPEKGWVIMPSHEVGETMVYDLADYTVDLYIANNANKVSIAACTAGQWKGNHYHYEHNRARNFTWSASTLYKTVWSRAGETAIVGYVYPNHLHSGALAAQYIHDSLQLFEELYGGYPHNSLTFIEADFPDGMEYDGLFFLDQYYFANPGSDVRASLAALSVHETAHQWWLNLVGNNQAREPWLDEALSTYSELLFYERYYPAYRDWWWNYRVNAFEPKGWVNSDVYSFSNYRAYVNAVYLRGAQFFAHLREELGDEAFFYFLHTYAERYRYQLITEKDFFNLLGELNEINPAELRRSFFTP